jgi:site-specific recombinase XerD
MDRAALSPLLRSFERHLRAENRSERTVDSYLQSARQAETFLAGRGLSLTGAGRADLEAFLGDLLGRRAAATAATRYKVLRILYRWLEEEDEVAVNPMAKMRPPIVPEQPVPVVPEDGLRRLLATCAGKSFEDRRDTALILLLVDVGPRRAELMGLKVADVDFDLDVLLVLGKGRRERALPFGRKSAVVLDRYVRVRARHKDAGLPWLWLGMKGRLTEWGLVMMLRRRSPAGSWPASSSPTSSSWSSGSLRPRRGSRPRSPRPTPAWFSCSGSGRCWRPPSSARLVTLAGSQPSIISPPTPGPPR